MITNILLSISEEGALSHSAMAENVSSTMQTATFGAEKYYRFEESAAPLGEENDFQKKANGEVKSYLSFRFTDGFSDSVVKSIQFPLIFWRKRGNQFPN